MHLFPLDVVKTFVFAGEVSVMLRVLSQKKNWAWRPDKPLGF